MWPLVSFKICAAVLAAVTAVFGNPVLEDFASPPSIYRAKFRYWFPDASVDPDVISKDIHDIADVGGGGVEFLSFYGYGQGPAMSDWTKYGFGGEPFIEVLRSALQATADRQLHIDLPFGANQGQGVPAEAASPGTAKQLVYGRTAVKGANFTGGIPPPDLHYEKTSEFIPTPEDFGPNELVAVVAAKTAGNLTATPELDGFSWLPLVEESLADLTNVTNNGDVGWQAPDEEEWVVFAFYERYLNLRSVITTGEPDDFLGNGSWVFDHWSVEGAKKVTEFWDDYILVHDDIDALARQVGDCFWQDSLELQSALWWTPAFRERFEELHGYDCTKYLPLYFSRSNRFNQSDAPYRTEFVLGNYTAEGGSQGARYVRDYQTTLTEAYADSLRWFAEWAETKGMRHSAQPAYNLPMEMARAIPLVDVPELETLAFQDDVELYRQFSGPAHLGGRNVVSTELGAVLDGAYKLNTKRLQQLIATSFAGGVNRIVLHGYAYSGDHPLTTWPGYTPFDYLATELWGPRQPYWDYFNDTMLWSARTSMVLQQGVPKVDIAFYYYQAAYEFGGDVYRGADFNEVGFSYEYVGGPNLLDARTSVTNGILAADGPAYKALMFHEQTEVTPQLSARLLDFAAAHLPIYFVGSVPNTTIGAKGQDEVTENMEMLLQHPSVKVLPSSEFSTSKLLEDGIEPRIKISTSGRADGIYTSWTSGAEAQYAYVINKGDPGTFTLTFTLPEGSVPLILDAWTGETSILGAYDDSQPGELTVEFTLATYQTKLLAFVIEDAPVHVTSWTDNIKRIERDRADRLHAVVSDHEDASVTLNDGTQLSMQGSQPPDTVELKSWSLEVDAFLIPDDVNSTIHSRRETIEIGQLDSFVSWTEIPELKTVSGIGRYSTTFSIEAEPRGAGLAVEASFGTVLNTIRVWINGQVLPPIDLNDPVADISGFVREGENTVTIEAASTLFNTVKENWENLLSASLPPVGKFYGDGVGWEEQGLLGPISINFLRRVELH